MADDPTITAYLKSLGFDVGTPQYTAAYNADAGAQQRIGQLQGEFNYQLPEIQHQGELQRRDIGYSFEDRGLDASGTRLRDLAEQRRRQAYQIGLGQLQLSDQIAAINLGLSATLGTLGQQSGGIGASPYGAGPPAYPGIGGYGGVYRN